jgi:phage terminase large subunit-like protein
MKKDSVYGWEEEIKNKEIHAIHFKSGVSIYFKTYEQDVHHLQTSTVYAIFTDEELPYELFGELRARLTATNGYFHMVFTATMGQDEWRRTIEPRNDDEELFRGAFKRQVSLYDCLKYKDGKSTFWNLERIKEVELQCVTENEVLKRVHGRFVVTGGLKCEGFDRIRNIKKKFDIPSNWVIYSGVDIGSGGEDSHPAAICLVAVRPDYKLGVVFRGWRGDGIVTASNDILVKHEELMRYEVPDAGGGLMQYRYAPALQSYDWQAKDFFTIASRAGIAFVPAVKHREQGENLLNTLFKLGMLVIFDDDVELNKLITEIITLKKDERKQIAKDDFYDALRYCVAPIPWDFEGVAGEILKNHVIEEEARDERSERQKHFDERRAGPEPLDDIEETLEDEIAEWQSMLDIS